MEDFMNRPIKTRKVRGCPIASSYKPSGIPKRDLKMVTLSVEGLEALRLADVEKMEQEKAAELMEVSRPTFSRIVTAARTTVAEALVNGWGLQIDGGNFVYNDDPANKIGKGRGCGHGLGRGLGVGKGQGNRTSNNQSNNEVKGESGMTKIAISSTGSDLNSKVDARFGRANNFIIVDADTMEFEHIDNSKVNEMGSGAGIQTAEMIVNAGVDVVLTGAVGPKALAVLNAGNVTFFDGYNGDMTVAEAIEKYKA
jgi:predicted DNA-binding protein (UPF0251 family)/predicted Fe-Mo cluster-binding NifX family protein